MWRMNCGRDAAKGATADNIVRKYRHKWALLADCRKCGLCNKIKINGRRMSGRMKREVMRG